MEYKTEWWEANENEIQLEDILKKHKGWKIFQMFLIYKGTKEAYRIVLCKTII